MLQSIRLRRSLLYVPGDREAMLVKAAGRGADGLILNLEDAVAPANKELARQTVARGLQTLDFGPAEVIVRVNPLDTADGYRDLLAVIPAGPHAILLPKTGSAEAVRFAAWTVERLEEIHGLTPGRTQIMCMLESAAGSLAAAEIAACHPRVAALIFGANDLATELHCTPYPDGLPLLDAASRLILAARAAGVDAIDSPHMRLRDPDGLARSSQWARELGFDGKSAIHPEQIAAINAAFSPSAEEIAWARRVVALLHGDDAMPLGAALLDGQLIEAPHLAQARRILAVAERVGL
ncbi:MAG: CoA ester lyase [Chloroflexi bacterium]|nr:CoA ester lyase [Chloroflexota bacterium]